MSAKIDLNNVILRGHREHGEKNSKGFVLFCVACTMYIDTIKLELSRQPTIGQIVEEENGLNLENTSKMGKSSEYIMHIVISINRCLIYSIVLMWLRIAMVFNRICVWWINTDRWLNIISTWQSNSL